MRGARLPAVALVVLAAGLFGASFPLSKRLLAGAGPLALAGLLYVGCGFGTAMLRQVRRLRSRGVAESPLRKSDLPWLGGTILAGGIVAPVLLLFGLARTEAHVSAFLVNSETVFTLLLAVLFFGDSIGRRELLGAILILAGAGLVSAGGADSRGPQSWIGPLLLLGAGLGWGLDNNFTQRLSERDPLQIAAIKGVVAGATNLVLAFATGAPPARDLRLLGSALLLGFACYGLSLALFVVGLRHLGAARTSALFAINPGLAALLAWVILGEVPRAPAAAGGLLMIPGAWLLIRTTHSHLHVHESREHEHRHVHDEHHQHSHRGDEGPEPHSHPHRHERLEHEHPHSADLHHRHDH